MSRGLINQNVINKMHTHMCTRDTKQTYALAYTNVYSQNVYRYASPY